MLAVAKETRSAVPWQQAALTFIHGAKLSTRYTAQILFCRKHAEDLAWYNKKLKKAAETKAHSFQMWSVIQQPCESS